MIPLIAMKMLSSSSAFDKSPDIQQGPVGLVGVNKVVKIFAIEFPGTDRCGSCTKLKTAHHKVEEADVVVSEDQARASLIIHTADVPSAASQ